MSLAHLIRLSGRAPRQFLAVIVVALTFSCIVLKVGTGVAFADVGLPSWWSGKTCDTNNYPGSYQESSGSVYNGVIACGPGPLQGGTDHSVQFTGYTWTEYEWECVELSMRYMDLVYGIGPYNAPGGKDVVNNYSGSVLTKINNDGTHLPSPGDIISESGTASNPYGHTAVVSQVSVTNGSGTVTIIQQNIPNNNGVGTISVSNNILDSNVTGWLHTPPQTVPWNFENLEGGSNPISPYVGNVGHAPASVVFNGQLYVYYYDSSRGDLRVAYTAPQWLFDVVDGEGGGSGKLSADVGQVPSAVVFNNVMYVFYYDNTNGNLRMAWSSTGTSWQAETLDGDAGSLSGYSANVGQTPFVTVYNNSLQLVYYQPDQGVLRHAWSSNGSSWNFETLDGNSGSISGFSGNVGQDPSATVYNNTLQLFYYNATQGDLRHAWADSSGWHFENLDGDAGSIGHIGANVGGNPTAYLYQNDLGVLYYDKTHGALRHAWSDSSGWHFETLAGGSGSVLGDSSNIGTMSTATVDSSGALQVFVYQAGGGNLVHLWSDSTGWHEENLDGAGGQPAGRIDANVGLDPDAIMYGTTLDVFYYDADNGALRHTWPQ